MSIRHFTAAILAACTVFAAAPAIAAEPVETDLGIELAPPLPTYRMGRSYDEKSPWLAAGLSLVGPAAMGLAASSVFQMPSPSNIKVNGMPPYQFGGMMLALASPIGLGFGQAYAGDPWRGFFVGLGGPAAVATCGVAGFTLETMLNPGARWAGITGLTLGVLGGAVGYNVWAAADAFETAQKRNESSVRP